MGHICKILKNRQPTNVRNSFFHLGNVHKWCPILGGEGGSSKMGQNGTRGVGRKVKVWCPIFQAFLPLFFRGFFFFPFFSILFQCDSFINISWKCRFIKIRMLLSYHYRNQVRGGGSDGQNRTSYNRSMSWNGTKSEWGGRGGKNRWKL